MSNPLKKFYIKNLIKIAVISSHYYLREILIIIQNKYLKICFIKYVDKNSKKELQIERKIRNFKKKRKC